MVTAIEAPFALLQEEVKTLFGHPVEAPKMPLCLVPEVLDPIDVVPFVDEPFRVVDPNMVEVRHIQSIVARKAIRVDDAVGWIRRSMIGINVSVRALGIITV